MLKITGIYYDYKANCKGIGIVGGKFNVGWQINGSEGQVQKACRVRIRHCERYIYDSGNIITSAQNYTVDSSDFPQDEILYACVTVSSADGETDTSDGAFYVAGSFDSPFICAAEDRKNAPVTFTREISLDKKPSRVAVYVCGIGYYTLYVNGKRASGRYLPAQSDYTDTCYYNVHYVDLNKGGNTVAIEVADGWRRISSSFVERNLGGRSIEFDGVPTVSSQIRIYGEGSNMTAIDTGADWSYSYGHITYSNIFNGETYDSNAELSQRMPAVIYSGITGEKKLQLLQQMGSERYRSVSMYRVAGGYMYDFGQNIAGSVCVRLPKHTEKDREITVLYGEMLNEDGTIYTAPLREAKCTDKYICSGTDDKEYFMPEYTFHGFRYAFVTGLSYADRDTVCAYAFYTDLENNGSFECGSPLVNKIHENAYMTERDNMHSILSDCPQRDERMGWLNDATVRFEETPYNFDIGQMFPKIVDDILDAQKENGMIGCTAPFIFGQLPADPVCSSFLVAAERAYAFTGNTDVIKRGFSGFAAWEDVLLQRSDNYIVNYSYYGDWAAPSYACVTEEFACSAVTPGILMSTGYSYYNCKTLEKFSSVLGYSDKEKYYRETAGKIAEAFCNKWLNVADGTLECGSMGAYAFALWLGILPENCREKAAKHMRDDLVSREYRFTTGNLTTRYLYDMLAKYGYINEAWTLLTRDEYPSIGYEINNGATTVWERFELKKNPDMNSHNHPMYGAVDYFIHAYLAGIKVTQAGCRRIAVKPYMPDKLNYCRDTVPTVLGDIEVKWVNQFGKRTLTLTVPFGMTADIDFCGVKKTVTSGSVIITV